MNVLDLTVNERGKRSHDTDADCQIAPLVKEILGLLARLSYF